MPTVTEKLAALQARVHGGLANQGASLKHSAIAAGVGAAAQYGVTYLQENVDYVKQNWWASPAVLAIGGHLLKMKNQAAGLGLLGAAGFLAAAQCKATHPATPESKGFAGDLAEGVVAVSRAPSRL